MIKQMHREREREREREGEREGRERETTKIDNNCTKETTQTI